MLQLTKSADYGIVILSHFARAGESAPVLSAKSVSEATRLSLPMVSKILKTLVKGGLLASQQGTKGGYRLAKPAARISIAEAIEALEGPLMMTECTGEVPGACKTEHACAVKPHWSKINRAIVASLRGLSLMAMAAPATGLAFGAAGAGEARFFPLTTKETEKH